MKKIVTVCSNSDCETDIHEGQQVWHKGSDLYCNLNCLMATFGATYKRRELLREKDVLAKQERIAMMKNVFKNRQKKVLSK